MWAICARGRTTPCGRNCARMDKPPLMHAFPGCDLQSKVLLIRSWKGRRSNRRMNFAQGWRVLSETSPVGPRIAQEVAKRLERLTPRERAEFLQYEERKAKAEGDFQILRLIQEYRKHQ